MREGSQSEQSFFPSWRQVLWFGNRRCQTKSSPYPALAFLLSLSLSPASLLSLPLFFSHSVKVNRPLVVLRQHHPAGRILSPLWYLPMFLGPITTTPTHLSTHLLPVSRQQHPLSNSITSPIWVSSSTPPASLFRLLLLLQLFSSTPHSAFLPFLFQPFSSSLLILSSPPSLLLLLLCHLLCPSYPLFHLFSTRRKPPLQHFPLSTSSPTHPFFFLYSSPPLPPFFSSSIPLSPPQHLLVNFSIVPSLHWAY